MIPEHGFCKEERLCGKYNIDTLFDKGKSFIHYPLRVIYLPMEEKNEYPCSVLINVSKKKFKRANKRNLIKRHLREAYRLNKSELYNVVNGKDYRLHLAILYLDNRIGTFNDMEERMRGVFRILKDRLP